MKQKYYLIYQITNNINGKIYIGVHETYKLDDNYFGSGKRLFEAKTKYGLENFTFKVLMFLQNSAEMYLLEQCVVTPEFCAREDTYNLIPGGTHGWNNVYKYKSIEEQKEIRSHAGQAVKDLWKNLTPEEYLLSSQILSQNASNWHQNNPGYFAGKNNPMYHHKYTQETLIKMSNSKQGKKNNRYGSKWYYDPITFESKSFLSFEKIPSNWLPGRKIKKK